MAQRLADVPAADLTRVVERFGGPVEMARALKHRSHTTVLHWLKSGNLPYVRLSEIREAARRRKVQLPPSFKQ